MKKEIYEKNIEKCFPPFDEEKFNKEILQITKDKSNKNKLKENSNTWLFKEFEENPTEVLYNDIKEKDKFIININSEEREDLDINLDILKTKDLNDSNSLDKIISILKNGFSISQALTLIIGKLEKNEINEIFNYLYEIYKTTKESTNSILSKEINIFKNSFESLCLLLIDAKVDLSDYSIVWKATN